MGAVEWKGATRHLPQNLKNEGNMLYKLLLPKMNKLWEEIIAYFPLIRHGPHRKRKTWGGVTDSMVTA
jgi:hypothetical protein